MDSSQPSNGIQGGESELDRTTLSPGKRNSHLVGAPIPEPQSLRQTVGHGLSWAAASVIWAKATSLVAQIILGIMLPPEDWALYAIAVAASSFVTCLRDAGLRDLIIQKGNAQYDTIRGPVFWIAMITNGLLGALLLSAAPSISRFYGHAELYPLICVLAFTIWINTPTQMLRAKLRSDLKFAASAQIMMAGSTAQYGSSIVLALMGCGPMSFVLPLPIRSVVEWALLGYAVGITNSSWNPRFALWPGLLREGRWLLLGAFSMALLTMGDYAVLGVFVRAETVGYYFFAFQLVVQSLSLVASGVETVLLPSISRLAGDLVRYRLAVLRALRCLMVASSGGCMLLASVIDPLEEGLWHSKWAPSVLCVQILSIALPVRINMIIVEASLKAQGEFRRWGILALGQGVGLVLAAAFAGALSDSAWVIATTVSGYFIVAGAGTLALGLCHAGLTKRDLCRALLGSWVIAIAVFLLCTLVNRVLADAASAWSRTLIVALSFSAVYAGCCRLWLPGHLDDLLTILPNRAARNIRALMRLPAKSVTEQRV